MLENPVISIITAKFSKCIIYDQMIMNVTHGSTICQKKMMMINELDFFSNLPLEFIFRFYAILLDFSVS